jgi:DNA repair protein RecN (Recombination protein N)
VQRDPENEERGSAERGWKKVSVLTDLTIKTSLLSMSFGEFGPGLNALTGETGAGKSILVDAINLLLGSRASSEMIRTGQEEAAVEAVFELGQDDPLPQFRELGIDV